jgi:hypothetical protein
VYDVVMLPLPPKSSLLLIVPPPDVAEIIPLLPVPLEVLVVALIPLETLELLWREFGDEGCREFCEPQLRLCGDTTHLHMSGESHTVKRKHTLAKVMPRAVGKILNNSIWSYLKK